MWYPSSFSGRTIIGWITPSSLILLALADEIEAVAKIAKAHGTKKTAELLGKKSQYVSKRVRVYKANSYLWDFIKLGYSNPS
jgi:hypothetical protein